MAFNVELAKKVRQLIAEEPRRLNMEWWGSPVTLLSDYEKNKQETPPCGTVACLAGWTIFAARPELFEKVKTENQHLGILLHDSCGRYVEEEAADLLGLNRHECPFWRTNWGTVEVLEWLDEQIAKASAKV